MKASAICRLGTTVSCVALTAFFQAGPALAQNVPSPPVRQPVDENGVDTSNGTFNVTTTDVSVGEGEGAMTYVRSHNGDGWRDNLTGSLTSNGTTMTASIGDSSSTFTISGTTYTSDQADGSILTFAAPAQEYTYVTDNGTTAIFAASNGAYTPYGNAGYLRSITRPNGTKITINNVTGQFCPAGQGSGSACAVAQTSALRVQSATSSTGYQLKLEFASNALADAAGLSDWYRVTKVVGINNAVENCNPTAPTCTLTGNWPQLAYSVSGNTETETNSAGGQHVFTYDAAGRILTIKRPAATTASTTITYGGSDSRVWSVANEGVTQNYAWSQS